MAPACDIVEIACWKMETGWANIPDNYDEKMSKVCFSTSNGVSQDPFSARRCVLFSYPSNKKNESKSGKMQWNQESWQKVRLFFGAALGYR